MPFISNQECRQKAALFKTKNMNTTIISSDIRLAIELLKKNELVAIPTETVYGLAANATSEEAVRRVFEVKGRPLTNPLIVHTDSIEKIENYVETIPAAAKRLLEKFSPGPLTLLLRSNGKLPSIINNGHELIAFRIPSHRLTLSLLQQLPFPVVAPSANRFTSISPTNVWHVYKDLSGQIPFVLNDGSCDIGVESTVVGFDGEVPVIYRQGAITAAQIEEVLGKVKLNSNHSKLASPGMLSKHYSPNTPLYLVNNISKIPLKYEANKTGLLCFTRYNYNFPVPHQFLLSVEGSLKEAARNFYKALHYLDELQLKCIIAEKLPNIGLGITLNDRLQRAAHPSPQPANQPIQTTDSLCQEPSFASIVR